MNPIISLIAPAYNVEKYIEACVHSCENQDLPRDSYEIIIVEVLILLILQLRGCQVFTKI